MIEVQKDVFFSADKKDMDLELIFNFVHNSYWGKGRTFEEQNIAMQNTLNFGLFQDGNQIAYTRVMTDKMFFAYLLDFFVLDDYQGKGIGKLLMTSVLDFPILKNIDKWMLATSDAHELYAKFGFEAVKDPSKLMDKMSERAKNIYE